MTLTNSKFAIIPFCFDVFKIIFFVNDPSSVTVIYMVLMLHIGLLRISF